MGKDPDFLGLGGYASSGSKGDAAAASSSSSGDDSDSQSVDSAQVRAAEAEARLRDYGAESGSRRVAPLPSALDAFGEVTGRPAFLDPEATRPIAVSATHGLAFVPGGGGAAAGAAGGQRGGRSNRGHGARGAAGGEFDIASLAPPLKGQQQ